MGIKWYVLHEHFSFLFFFESEELDMLDMFPFHIINYYFFNDVLHMQNEP